MAQLAEFIGNHLFLSLAFMAVFFLFLLLSMSEKMQAFKQISPAELTQLVNHKDAVLVDTRNPNDYTNGHIVNAINMPLADLVTGKIPLEKLKDKPVIAYCVSGVSSKSACKYMTKAGHAQVFNLAGGINAWINEKLPVIKK